MTRISIIENFICGLREHDFDAVLNHTLKECLEKEMEFFFASNLLNALKLADKALQEFVHCRFLGGK